MEQSAKLFAEAEVNQRRQARGELPATQIWLWGQGRRPALAPFQERYGVRGAVITAVDLLRGIGRLIGWDVIEVPGATGYLDTDYAAKGRYAVQALETYDFVTVHVEATDEASHEGHADAKVQALEQIDQHIVGPVHAALKKHGDYRLLVCPDHPTFLRTKTHSHGFVPFAMCGAGIEDDRSEAYDEVTAATAGLSLPRGWELMSRFIGRQG
jgi:2,3-bisphosphoglycerate-independent phosphoglycerate mutase